MQYLEGSGTPVLYIESTALKGKSRSLLRGFFQTRCLYISLQHTDNLTFSSYPYNLNNTLHEF
jgi:hypothetical protein